MKKISLVVAYALSNLVIGNSKTKNKMPGWMLRTDLYLFKKRTTGHTVIMGRKTAEAIFDVGYFPLSDRINIIVSRDPNYVPPGGPYEKDVYVCTSLEAAIELAEKLDPARTIFLAGGGELYAYALKHLVALIEKIVATEVEGEFEGDVFFPKLDRLDWREIEDPVSYSANEKNSHNFVIRTLAYSPVHI